MRKHHLTAHLVAAACLLAAAAPASLAQAPYPTQQIKIICPFPAGGGTDLTSRLLGAQLQAILGQPVVVENRTSTRRSPTTGTGTCSPSRAW